MWLDVVCVDAGVGCDVVGCLGVGAEGGGQTRVHSASWCRRCWAAAGCPRAPPDSGRACTKRRASAGAPPPEWSRGLHTASPPIEHPLTTKGQNAPLPRQHNNNHKDQHSPRTKPPQNSSQQRSRSPMRLRHKQKTTQRAMPHYKNATTYAQ